MRILSINNNHLKKPKNEQEYGCVCNKCGTAFIFKESKARIPRCLATKPEYGCINCPNCHNVMTLKQCKKFETLIDKDKFEYKYDEQNDEVRMEHLVQFAISVDDEKIKQTIENNVMKQVVNKLSEECLNEIADKESNYTYNTRQLVNDNVQKFFDKNKDLIIFETSNKLAEKLVKTKAVREAVEKLLGE